MQWELKPDEGNPLDPHGIGNFLKRLERALPGGAGEPLRGFTFLQDAGEMFRFTRQIEGELLKTGSQGPLYVGYQTAEKAGVETERYRRMRDAGIVAKAFGTGRPATARAGIFDTWHEVRPSRTRLENQWFLVSMAPAPIAFVGWEVSPDELWGKGGATAAGKEFVGFVSDDERVVRAIITHLEDILAGRQDEQGELLSALIERIRPGKLLALADDGKRPFLTRGLDEALKGAALTGAQVYLYDLSAASYLVSPYPSGEGDWRRPLDPKTLRSLGRSYLAETVERARQAGVAAGGVLPEGVGFDELAKWCDGQGIDLVVLPVEYTRPSLMARLQGLTLETLRSKADVSVVVEDPERGSWLVSTPDATRTLVA